jgi:uncharacterized pyridoxamine 5'-phosphate oxidase family protein
MWTLKLFYCAIKFMANQYSLMESCIYLFNSIYQRIDKTYFVKSHSKSNNKYKQDEINQNISIYTCFDWFKKLRLFSNVRNLNRRRYQGATIGCSWYC